ncbi:MAG: hypothetical protein JNK50_07355 [Bacteroidia bacterium]|nr:hypothetical protein [Bacteroidia bacterium]
MILRYEINKSNYDSILHGTIIQLNDDAFLNQNPGYCSWSYDSRINNQYQAIAYSIVNYSRSLRLSDVSIRLKISKDKLASILKDAGFLIPRNSNYLLKEHELNVLFEYFDRAVKERFKKFKKQNSDIHSYEYSSEFEFYSQFLVNYDPLYLPELANTEFDSNLFRQWFFKLLFTEYYDENQNNFNLTFLSKLKFKLVAYYKNMRAHFFTIIITNHYHIFTGEEDSTGIANQKNDCFSDTTYNTIGKALNKINLKLIPNAKKYRNFNKQNQTVRLY